MPKRKMSAEGRKRISEAQKKRWANKKSKVTTKESVAYAPLVIEKPVFPSYVEAFRFLRKKMITYSSITDAYVNGYLDGYDFVKE